MFRYRQTQHLQKRLEKRFGEYLKPFGIGTEPNGEPQKQKPERQQKRSGAKSQRAAQPTQSAQH